MLRMAVGAGSDLSVLSMAVMCEVTVCDRTTARGGAWCCVCRRLAVAETAVDEASAIKAVHVRRRCLKGAIVRERCRARLRTCVYTASIVRVGACGFVVTEESRGLAAQNEKMRMCVGGY